jgi:hypothetical protein
MAPYKGMKVPLLGGGTFQFRMFSSSVLGILRPSGEGILPIRGLHTVEPSRCSTSHKPFILRMPSPLGLYLTCKLPATIRYANNPGKKYSIVHG